MNRLAECKLFVHFLAWILERFCVEISVIGTTSLFPGLPACKAQFGLRIRRSLLVSNCPKTCSS